MRGCYLDEQLFQQVGGWLLSFGVALCIAVVPGSMLVALNAKHLRRLLLWGLCLAILGGAFLLTGWYCPR